MVPGLLKLPPSIDLHKHPLVLNGSIFMQVRLSFIGLTSLNIKISGRHILTALPLSQAGILLFHGY